jgi:hypothetical protein
MVHCSGATQYFWYECAGYNTFRLRRPDRNTCDLQHYLIVKFTAAVVQLFIEIDVQPRRRGFLHLTPCFKFSGNTVVAMPILFSSGDAMAPRSCAPTARQDGSASVPAKVLNSVEI